MPFDDREGVIWYNGSLVPWRDAKFHVLSHGMHYASCVFEGERAYSGEIFKIREHSERLIHSARCLDFELPYTATDIDKAKRDLVATMKISDGYVRAVAWRGSEMMGISAQTTAINVAIAAWAWPSYFSPEARLKGIRLKTAPWKRPSPETAPVMAKAAGLYMICTLSKHSVEREGYDDALMLDWKGRIAEATGANIFFVIDGVLHTPTPDCFLNGITRRTVVDLARARGFKIVERRIFPDELAGVDEVFLTGTAAEVTPIGEIDARNFQVGPITRALMEDYEALVRRQAT
tara:strand:+ start:7587 stop:8459 length:873 start_codon:yes stop_codon:yes gene_type:complete